jgi:putative salt-induced outer membrane protein YdiY
MILALTILYFSFASTASAAGILNGWTGDIFLGYNQSNGNTKKASGSASGQALKKFDHSQFLLKGDIFYSETNKTMDGQKWDASSKYSLDFGSDYKWYNFYQVLVDHDYFADIDYRITPTAGLGRHIAVSEEWTWDADLGVGYRITRHRTNTAEDDETPTTVAHTFMKKKILEKAFISEDMTVYPGLTSGAGISAHSESVFTNPLRADLDLEIRYIVDYNSEPAGKKKTDTQLIAGIKYKF